jgi:WD40 repeat protein
MNLHTVMPSWGKVNARHLLRSLIGRFDLLCLITSSFNWRLFRRFLCVTLLLWLSLEVAILAQSQVAAAERIAFAAYRHGQWDIYSIAPDGSDPRQLTNDAFEDTDPAYSPDGTKIAFASRRDNNWDVYLLDLESGEETRLTRSPHYEGAPAWRPDGKRLAYESYQNGNLDIWLTETTDDGAAINLTVDSLAGDFAPAWSPDGRSLAFTSWRQGSKDLYLFNLESQALTQLTHTSTPEEYPVWQPDGQSLAFVVDNLGEREVFALDLSTVGALGVLELTPPSEPRPIPLTWLGRTDGPAWSPAGDRLAAVFHRWDGDIIAIQQLGAAHQLPHLLTGPIAIQGRLTWQAKALNFGPKVATLADTGPSALYDEKLTPNDASHPEPYNLVRMNDVETGTPWLADTVNDSFLAWRFRVRAEVGYDFMSKLDSGKNDNYVNIKQQSPLVKLRWRKVGQTCSTRA